MFADFVKISALKKLNNLVERDRKNWAETFEELDEHGISRVPKDVFFKVVEVNLNAFFFFLFSRLFKL